MATALLRASKERFGYPILGGQTGGFNCRPISGTSKPSNHSWGLAIDINWDRNPSGSDFQSDIPPDMVAMWEDAGWFWGGWYRGGNYDPMHFEYLGRPSDVAEDASRAAYWLAHGTSPDAPAAPTPPQETDMPLVIRDEIPSGFDKAYCPSIGKVNAGSWGGGPAWLHLHTDMGTRLVRVAYRVAGKGWTVVSEGFVVDSAATDTLVCQLPDNTVGLSLMRKKQNAADADDSGSIGWHVEYGPRAA
jgi:hypothetical protein